MRSEAIIENIVTKVKASLQKHSGELNSELTAENAENVTQIIRSAITEAAAEGFKTYIQENENRENTIVHNGQKYRFNRTSNKEFSTIFGKTVLERRLYQNENGESFVPLDHAWNMENQFATIEVREAVLFALPLMPASEARQLFGKCSTFQLAESSFKKIAQQIEPHLENNIDELLGAIRQEEEMPIDEVKVVSVSQDGTNVLLQEPGKKRGRKRKRPGERQRESADGFDSQTSYKNAVVGSVSLYGAVPPDEKAPLRLQSRYLARMPEEKALTLKLQLQKEVEFTLSRLPKNVTKVFVSDAAQGIRKEVDTNPLFADFEKIIDYYHTCEHLSNAAEAIFGTGSSEADEWYESKRLLLLESESGANEIYRCRVGKERF